MSIAKSCMKIATGEGVDGLDDYAPKKKRKSSNTDIMDTRAHAQEIHIEYISPNVLVKYEHNSRTHSAHQVEQIKKSITEFGFTNPVLIDEDNVLIAGHGRVEAALQLKLNSVPAIRLTGLPNAKKKALRIADNKLPLNAGWDEEQLKLEVLDLQAENFDLDILGFSSDELSYYVNDIDIDGFFEKDEEAEGSNEKEDTARTIICPHCGKEIEVE